MSVPSRCRHKLSARSAVGTQSGLYEVSLGPIPDPLRLFVRNPNQASLPDALVLKPELVHFYDMRESIRL